MLGTNSNVRITVQANKLCAGRPIHPVGPVRDRCRAGLVTTRLAADVVLTPQRF